MIFFPWKIEIKWKGKFSKGFEQKISDNGQNPDNSKN